METFRCQLLKHHIWIPCTGNGSLFPKNIQYAFRVAFETFWAEIVSCHWHNSNFQERFIWQEQTNWSWYDKGRKTNMPPKTSCVWCELWFWKLPLPWGTAATWAVSELMLRLKPGGSVLVRTQPIWAELSWVLGIWVVCCVWLPVPPLVFLIGRLVGAVLDHS